jgi:multimeric flavodoxin WrbA
LVPYIEGLVSLMLRFPLLRIPYLLAMKSRLFPAELRDRLEMNAKRAVAFNPSLSKIFKTGKALIVYYSVTGNTEKVALAIERGVRKGGLKPVIKKVTEAYQEELFNYDLICFGTPVLHAFVPPPVNKFIRKKSREYGSRNQIIVPSPKIPGKIAFVFVTYSAPHIGIDEASPAGKYVKSFFGHLGFDVREEWYVIGEFRGLGKLGKMYSTRGFLGDIRGRPNAEDLVRIEEKTIKAVRSHFARA